MYNSLKIEKGMVFPVLILAGFVWILFSSFDLKNDFSASTSLIPDTPAICLVTVDTGIVKNVIVWQKTSGQHIKYYKIYKETNGINNWDSIGFRMFDSLSYFVDSNSLPKVKSAKYRLSAVDSSGNESAMSPHHRTINLLIQKSTGWTFDLLWTPYEGFNVSYYRIWRWSFGNGWKKIDSVQGNIHSYTDNPPPGLVYYFVETAPPHPCQVSKAQTNYNTSRSNRTTTSAYLTTGKSAKDCNIFIFPNPSREITYVEIKAPSGKNITLDLYSIAGQRILRYSNVLTVNDMAELQIDRRKLALPAGLYFLKIHIDGFVYTKKLIIND